MTTHSEDGCEVPKVVGTVTASGMRQGVNAVVGRLALHDLRPGDTLMTVAQHERIVTGLQAELETERQHAHDQHSAWTVCDAERQQLRAQPARQVGVDERAEFLAWATNNWTGSTESAWKVWAARAALAPAAVAVDSSASLINALEQVRTMVGNDEYADDVIGFINRSIHNHARLNRRAIPAGLLERIVNRDHMHTTEWWRDVTELRALLGKENI